MGVSMLAAAIIKYLVDAQIQGQEARRGGQCGTTKRRDVFLTQSLQRPLLTRGIYRNLRYIEMFHIVGIQINNIGQ